MPFDIIKTSFFNSLPAITIICTALIAIRIAYLFHHRGYFHFHKEFWMLIGTIYLLLIYDLLTRIDINTVSGINLIPFKEITRYSIHSKYFSYNIIGNILIFIPFGFILSSYAKPKKIWSSLIIGAIVSTTIEFVQYEIGRSFDIDDIILNTLGCIIGFIIYYVLQKIRRHLPNFMKRDWFNNLICIIITICIGFNILKTMGIIR